MTKFVHLHNHTEYSLLDGSVKIKDLIKKLKSSGMDSCAITDHGNMFGALEFYKNMKANNLKPIIGSEMYLAPDHSKKVRGSEGFHHIVLLAKNEVGYHNLMKLSGRSFVEGFYYKPRIDKKQLADCAEGLMAGSACLQGEIAKNIRFGRYDEAKNAVHSYKEIFGKDNFYIEIMRHNLPEQDRINPELIKLAGETNTPLVATNDCHFLEKENSIAHDALLCIQTGRVISDRERLRMDSDQFYVKTAEEMLAAFSDIKEAVTNSEYIADMTDLNLNFGNPTPPRYPFVENDQQGSYLRKLAVDGLEKRFNEDSIDANQKIIYRKRLEYELTVIEKMKFPGYFLIVWDFIYYAKTHDIPVGPGRGSAAGSLVAYALSITDIDPIKYKLLFERFLNPERVSMPDIDVDISNDKRQQVIDYVVEKYGADKTAQVITFGTMKAKGVIRDVGRVLSIPYSDVDKIAKLVPDTLDITLETAAKENNVLKKRITDDPAVAQIYNIAKVLEGLKRHASTHAAGIVISDEPLEEKVPLYKSPNEQMAVVQYSKEYLEDINLIKFDFLGLKTLMVIEIAVRFIHENEPDFNISKIPLDNEKTYKNMSEGNTLGMFQLESSGMQDIVRHLDPNNINDVVALVALFRPGPLGSGMVKDFIERKKGKQAVKYSLPELKDILKETYGVILYQEQVMQITMKLAGYSAGEADVLRRAIGKKKPEIVAKEKIPFVKRAVERGIRKRQAEEIYDLMAYFAGYGFNKSHSAAYGLIAYQTAYLKTNYPVEFMSALLSSDQDNTAKITKYIDECERMGILVLPPDVNLSDVSFSPSGSNQIRFGLGAVKNVGNAAIHSILEERKNSAYKDFYDFISRIDMRKCNKKVLESLIKVGAFDQLEKNRMKLLENLPVLIEWAISKKSNTTGMTSLFGESDTSPQGPALINVAMPSDKQIFLWENELLGFFLSGNPLSDYESVAKAITEMSDPENAIISGVITDISEKTTKKRTKMAYIKIHTTFGAVSCVVFPHLYAKIESKFQIGDPAVVFGRIEEDQNKEIKSTGIISIEEALEIIKKIAIDIKYEMINEQFLSRIDNLFSNWPGDFPLFMKIKQDKKSVVLKTGGKFRFKLNLESLKYLCDNFQITLKVENNHKKRSFPRFSGNSQKEF
ncbi:MAG: DNA polymerase III subunit alpha [Epsilonproteobacteria bacterium]|nr:DNA polymerase III subunit alpha [Campylobacterota bacterium]